MLRGIKVKKSTMCDDIFFFDEMDFDKLDDKRMILLFGPNGAGKSTLLNQIITSASNPDRSEIEVIRDQNRMSIYTYFNRTDNFRCRRSRSLAEEYDINMLADRFNANSVSEGQSIVYSVIDLLIGLTPGKKMFTVANGVQSLVILDEIDSGLSIDNIDLFMRKIKNILKKRDDVQFIMSFNSPRVLKHFGQVISMYDGSVLNMRSEDDMLEQINIHKVEFDKNRKMSDGRPRAL